MTEIDLDPYIPTGCLVIDTDATDGWSAVASHTGWLWTAQTTAGMPVSAFEAAACGGGDMYLSLDIARLVAQALPSADLLHADWVRAALRFVVEMGSPPRRLAIVRVYALPEDQCRHLVRRDNASSLTGRLKKLLASLDYAPELWAGTYGGRSMCLEDVQQQPASADTDKESESSTSLLHMFNTIPSPQPQLGILQDDDAYQTVLDGLATSRLRGLTATLYDYQVRSATVMVQREVQPGRVLDPRLVTYKDQNQEGGRRRVWYYDDVAGTVLRAPRYYDGVAGGILAEEMGTGKTVICLAVILATRAFPVPIPEVAAAIDIPEQAGQRGVQSLADMAAAVVSRAAVPWKLYLEDEQVYGRCMAAIARHPPTYSYTLPQYAKTVRGTTRERRGVSSDGTAIKITASTCSLVLVPANLVRQWEQEIAKHTEGLQVIVVDAKRSQLPSAREVLAADVLLFAMPQFEGLMRFRVRVAGGSGYRLQLDLAHVHYKRVIVDEGHRLGNSRMSRKSNVLLVLECLAIAARWIVTGTPSTGLFGVEGGVDGTVDAESSSSSSSNAHERKDLERIGSMASLYLGMRPWANTAVETISVSGGGGRTDRPTDWNAYMTTGGRGRRGQACLRSTLDALIVRHRKAEVSRLLPSVTEKVVVLDGSVQDRLCLNLFAMMIIFNAVQSQRVDQDYFFHGSQRRALVQLVSNMRQSTFFGAYFYPTDEIKRALATAEAFLAADGTVPISGDDEQLLREAIAFGRVAVQNRFKRLADACHDVPILVAGVPGGRRDRLAWSMDRHGEDEGGDIEDEDTPICTTAPAMRALQQLMRPCLDAPHALQAMISSGRFAAEGRQMWEGSAGGGGAAAARRAGAGDDSAAGSPLKKRAGARVVDAFDATVLSSPPDLAPPLARTQLTATASAKLSYLLDAIVQHQRDEKMLVFYDNENTAFYLAEHLELLQVQHLIYAKGLSAERRAQYVASFNGQADGQAEAGADFRVMLMDISQAAFGLDMWAASRMYFISPVLNPQVEAQAIGRVRRISQQQQRQGQNQQRQVSVETLVLRGSIEEVMLARRQTMTQADHRKMRTLLDDGGIYRWIEHVRIMPGASEGRSSEENSRRSRSPGSPEDQMAPLATPQYLFRRGTGRREHPDDGLVALDGMAKRPADGAEIARAHPQPKKQRVVPKGVRFA